MPHRPHSATCEPNITSGAYTFAIAAVNAQRKVHKFTRDHGARCAWSGDEPIDLSDGHRAVTLT